MSMTLLLHHITEVHIATIWYYLLCRITSISM